MLREVLTRWMLEWFQSPCMEHEREQIVGNIGTIYAIVRVLMYMEPASIHTTLAHHHYCRTTSSYRLARTDSIGRPPAAAVGIIMLIYPRTWSGMHNTCSRLIGTTQQQSQPPPPPLLLSSRATKKVCFSLYIYGLSTHNTCLSRHIQSPFCYLSPHYCSTRPTTVISWCASHFVLYGQPFAQFDDINRLG